MKIQKNYDLDEVDETALCVSSKWKSAPYLSSGACMRDMKSNELRVQAALNKGEYLANMKSHSVIGK